MVFHSPHEGQRPTHFGLFDPHDWHTYKVFERADGMTGILVGGTDSGPLNASVAAVVAKSLSECGGRDLILIRLLPPNGSYEPGT